MSKRYLQLYQLLVKMLQVHYHHLKIIKNEQNPIFLLVPITLFIIIINLAIINSLAFTKNAIIINLVVFKIILASISIILPFFPSFLLHFLDFLYSLHSIIWCIHFLIPHILINFL